MSSRLRNWQARSPRLKGSLDPHEINDKLPKTGKELVVSDELGPVNTTKNEHGIRQKLPGVTRNTSHRDPLRHVLNCKCASSRKAGLQIRAKALLRPNLRASLRTRRPRAAQNSLSAYRWNTFHPKNDIVLTGPR